MEAANDNRPINIWPRGLSRVLAATYIGISPSLFDTMVKDRRMPRPKHINARLVWDRLSVDAAFDVLSNEKISKHATNDAWEFAA